MRRRIVTVAVLAVVLVLGAIGVAQAHSWKPWIGPPMLAGKHHPKPVLGTEFKVTGLAFPAGLSTDTVSSVAIQVIKFDKEASPTPRWSQVATLPASFGKLVRHGAQKLVSYEASITISDPGSYKLRGAIVATDTIVAKSAPLPLFFRLPSAPGPMHPHH